MLVRGTSDMTARNEIRELLELAGEHDRAAREARKAAGRILAMMRDSMDDAEIERVTGLDGQTIRVLIRMAAGSEAP